MRFNHTMTLICAACGEPADFPADLKSLQCPNCKSRGRFFLPSGSTRKSARGAKNAPGSSAPVSVLKRRHSLEFSWRTFQPGHLALIPGLIFWGALLAVLYGLLHIQRWDLLLMVFIVLLMIVWIFMLYLTLALFFNTVTLRFTPRGMSRRHTPFMMWGEFDIPLDRLYQFYALGLEKPAKKRDPDRTAKRQKSSLLSQPADSYRLIAVLQNEREIRLFSGFSDPEVVFFIQENVERWMAENDAAILSKPSPLQNVSS